MKRTKLKLAVMVGLLAIAVVASLRSTTATNQPSVPDSAAFGVDLSNEERVIAKYADDLFAFDKQVVEVGKRARFVSSDLDPLQRKSDGLKSRLSEVQNAIREVIKKLKAANEWDNLDATTEAKITDARLKGLFREFSLKQSLEEDASGLASQASEIDLPLGNLRRKLAARFGESIPRMVKASYSQPTLAVASLRCRIQTRRNAMMTVRGGSPTNQNLDRQSCACNPGQSTGVASGVACDQVTELWPVNSHSDALRATESQ